MLAQFLRIALPLGILLLLLACSSPARFAGSAPLPAAQSPAAGSATPVAETPTAVRIFEGFRRAATPAANAAVPSRPPSAPKSSLKYPGGVPLDAAEIERWVIVLTNAEREKAGLRPLVDYPEIAAIAQAHSANMAQQETAKTQLDGKNPAARASAAGYACQADLGGGRSAAGLGENVIKHPRIKRWAEKKQGGIVVSGRPTAYDADSQAVAQTLISHWMRSSSGREAILKPGYIQIGVGVTIDLDTKRGWAWETVYAAQDFSSCG